MLSLIRISDYAVIDELEIELHSGFTVMTGETGAGKSILVDAVGLALGDRADAGTVRSGAKRAEISLVFDIGDGHPAQSWLIERGLDDDELCCLRRTITAEGRSRAFINNQPVTLKDLRALGALLVDIHGQHAHQSLLRTRTQRMLLDASAGHLDLCRSVAERFAEWQRAELELAARSESSADRAAELELLRFQLDEIVALGVSAGDYEDLRAESERLRHVDELRQSVGGSADCLYESESVSAYSLVSRARQMLESASALDQSLSDLRDRLDATEIELKEIGGELSRHLEALEADPTRLDQVESRLNGLQQLARRHRIEPSAAWQLAETLQARIQALDSSDAAIESLTQQRNAAARQYRSLATQLSESRQLAAATLAGTVTAELRELGLPAAEFRIHIETKAPGREDSTGMDLIHFQVTTNPGVPLGPIDQIASGGELARIGLALAVVATEPSSIPTLVFDEVDSGVGGAIAEVVGQRLHEIAAGHQVLCVTHLPQVASQGMHHFRIVKLSDGHSSRTQLRELDNEQRIDELARMLGGIEITAATRAHAAEMIERARSA